MINIVLFGPPGSGKGTQAQHLIEKFNLKQISTGDLFRYNMKNNTELGKLAKSYIDKGELVPDKVTIDMLIDELRKPTETNGFIFDGFPRTANQTEALETIVKDELELRSAFVCLWLLKMKFWYKDFLKEEKPAEEQMILTKILSETESKNITPKLQKLQNYTKNKVNM